MPFVNKHTTSLSPSSLDRQPLFVGRAEELHYCIEGILKPEHPRHNLISIYGQGGVGKSTLVQHWMQEATLEPFRYYCHTAYVNEHQITLSDLMECFAQQLSLKGDFPAVLARHKKVLSELQQEQETLTTKLLEESSKRKLSPDIQDLLPKEHLKSVEQLLERLQSQHQTRLSRHLEQSLHDLTRAFLHDLNALAEQEALYSGHPRRYRRIVLFFDTFEQLAPFVLSWLFDQVLSEDINQDIIFVFAGRDPLNHVSARDSARLQAYEPYTVYFPLDAFQEEEVQAYLAQKGIIDPDQLAAIWHLSHGLPLFLALLTVNPHDRVDPTADVIANFLQWIPLDDVMKRQFVLDMAFLSRPFSLDELHAFPYLSTEQHVALFHWLIRQPFVRASDGNGRYSYHEIVQSLFRRYLYNTSPHKWQETRQYIAAYYQEELTHLTQTIGENEIHNSPLWLELVLAQLEQLLLLATPEHRACAISLAVEAGNFYPQEIMRALSALKTEYSNILDHHSTKKVLQALIDYLEEGLLLPSLDSDDFREHLNIWQRVISLLIREIKRSDVKNSWGLSILYVQKARILTNEEKYDQALKDLEYAIEINQQEKEFYALKGDVYVYINQLPLALASYDTWLADKSHRPEDYISLGKFLVREKHYQEALIYIEQALALTPNDAFLHQSKGSALYDLQRYEEAMLSYDQAILLDPNKADYYCGKGAALFHLQRYEQALTAFKQAIRLDSSSAPFYCNKGATLSQLNRYEEALVAHDHAIRLNPNLASYHACKGEILYNLKRDEEALASFEQAILFDPNVASYYFKKGESLYNLKRDEEALAAVEQTILLDPDKANYHACKGAILFRLKRYEEALAAFKHVLLLDPHIVTHYHDISSILEKQPYDEEAFSAYERVILLFNCNNASYYHDKGATLFQLDRYEEALAAMNQAILLDPNNADYHSSKGRTLFKLQHYEEALTAYEQSLLLDPGNASYYRDKGAALFFLRRYESALAAHEQAILLDSNNADYHACKGENLFALHRYDGALVASNQAILLNPNNAGYYRGKGAALFALQQYEEALAAIDQATLLEPNKADYHACKGETLLALQQYEEALAAIDQAILLDLNKANYYQCKGDILAKLHRDEEALFAYGQALRLDPHNAACYSSKGYTLLLLNRYEEALTTYDQAILLSPDNAAYYFCKGLLLEHLQRYEAALSAYDQALRLNFDDEYLSTSKARVLEYLSQASNNENREN